ncbi:uncharacterized protein LOC124357691 isoform X3 [Homalodisca vitripennis]|uniref:uncharacterized protein LOC124357691 isoform X3 n=1 Tax=Homalodisca vitripennis TaxID=197043 RepID=UPI001EEC9E5D|nr:uncharacterized protein LOC124357691 isoform X3 [Homalodisca vitripennis]
MFSEWETVKLKNSQVQDWDGLATALKCVSIKHLDMRNVRMPDKTEVRKTWRSDCIKAISKVNTLVKLDLCRCTSKLLKQIAAICPQLEYIAAETMKNSQINMTNLGNCQNLIELNLRGLAGITVINVSLLTNLTKLKKLGQQDCPTNAIIHTISKLPCLNHLELINFDIKEGFDASLNKCSNISKLLLVPTYTSQVAATFSLVLEGVSSLNKTLKDFVLVVTLELLKFTNFVMIDERNHLVLNNTAGNSLTQTPQKTSVDYIPILRPTKMGFVPEMLLLPQLYDMLTILLPNTNILIRKAPFNVTWQLTIYDSNQ